MCVLIDVIDCEFLYVCVCLYVSRLCSLQTQ